MWQALQRVVKHPTLRGWLDHPVVFSTVRLGLVGLQRRTARRLRASLDLPPGSRVLDVCCGVGDFASLVDVDYHGIDLNPRFIRFARWRYARAPQKQFHVEDATRMRFPEQTFDTTLFINAMHHLPTDQVRGILREMARVTSRQVLVFDLEPQQGTWWQRAVMACDRGDYCRPFAVQRALLEECFVIQRWELYSVAFTVQTMFICTPQFGPRQTAREMADTVTP